MADNWIRGNEASHESLTPCEEIGAKGDFSHSEPTDSDTNSIERPCFYILVGRRGYQILMRREGDILSCCHDIDVQNSSYERAHLVIEEICTFFDISTHAYINAEVSLGDSTKEYSCHLTIVEVTEYECAVNKPFEWVDWRCSCTRLEDTCPNPRIDRFVKSFLSNMDVEEINLKPTPWRVVGFYEVVLPRITEILSAANCKMLGKPEQIHFGSLSTIFKIPTNEGLVFFKAGFKGNGEPRITQTVTSMFPDDTPRLLGVDLELEAMLSMDHGPSVHELYIVKTNERASLEECEIRSMFCSALMQWAGVQKKSINRVQELIENGVPEYNKSWIRAGFSELISYMKETGLDGEYDSIMQFEKNMEKTFDAWDHFNIPNTLVHGDLHNWNIAQPGGLGTKFIFFDWDSTFVGHPFLDLHCDETEEISVGVEGYVECWTEYGGFEELKKLVLWTEPVRYVIEAVRESRKEIWTVRERKVWTQYLLDSFSAALEKCDYAE